MQPQEQMEAAVQAALVTPSETWSVSKQQTEQPVEAALVRVLKAQLPDLVEVNDAAVQIARSQAADLLAGASATKKKVVRSLIRRGMEQGWSDTVLQARIAEKAGLDPRSATALENYRAGLKANNVPPGRAERMVEAYRKRLLKHRAMVIARTETQQALMDGQREIWARQQESGDLSPYAVRVTVTHKDDRLCPTCRPEGGRRRSLKRGAGGGPPFHPQCRCYEVLSDEGVVKAGPTGTDLYVEAPVLVLDPPTQKKRKKKKRDGRLAGMDDITKVITPGGRVGDDSPVGTPGGKQNWVDKAGGLPKYIRMVAHALIRSGKPKDRAISMAIGIVRNWAEGKGHTSAKVKAAAAKAIAEWEAKKAKAHLSKSATTTWNLTDYQAITEQLRSEGVI